MEQLQEMMNTCRNLGTEVIHRSEHSHFTAMLWNDWELSRDETLALSIQNQIFERTAQYPDLVCYRFDPFSTLIYTV